ncbi:UNVERIFIED_CONTAM: hypothetical protein GTU68_015360 [Idotea baltica]|nr:hypothetical protein [Idotea baltica]
MFLLKAITFVICALVVIGALIPRGRGGDSEEKGTLKVGNISERITKNAKDLSSVLLHGKDKKEFQKDTKKQQKEVLKSETGRLFVIDFKGDIQAKAAANLREEVTAVLAIAKAKDEVLVKVESGGGVVHGYGFAASQLDRIRSKGIPLTVAVDKVAASGGYMMACVADKIISAPFAILGSIGVVAQIPNFNRLLEKNEIDFEIHTAGEHKRTLTMFGKNTDEGRKKFVEDLEEAHVLFKDFVAEHREQLDIEKVATGEIWFGRQAIEMGLVDEVKTSDEYLMDRAQEHEVFEISYEPKKSLQEKLSKGVESSLAGVVEKTIERLQSSRFFS